MTNDAHNLFILDMILLHLNMYAYILFTRYCKFMILFSEEKPERPARKCHNAYSRYHRYQLSGCCCRELNESCNSFVSQFSSRKLSCFFLFLEVIDKSIYSSFSLSISHISVTFYPFQVPAIVAYTLCAFFSFQVLIGIVKVKKIDEREKLITGTA